MTDFDLGSTGNCLSCSKEREYVRGAECLDCRVHGGTAEPWEVMAYRYGCEQYERGLINGMVLAEETIRNKRFEITDRWAAEREKALQSLGYSGKPQPPENA